MAKVEKVTVKPNSAEIGLIIESLSLDKNYNYSHLEYYLKQIISGRDVVFDTRSDTLFVVPAKEAWKVILNWSQNDGNLPVGDRKNEFNFRSRATSLLSYIQTNLSGKSAEAAASYRLILEQAELPVPQPNSASPTEQDANLQKIYALRRKQIEILQKKLFDPLYTRLSKTKLLENIPDPTTRTLVLQMIAAGNMDFRHIPEKDYANYTAEKLHQMLLHRAGVRDVNQVISLIHSKNTLAEFKEVSNEIDAGILEIYKGDETSYQKDTESMREISSLAVGLNSVPYLLSTLDIGATPAEKEQLIRTIRSEIVDSAGSSHRSGNEIIQSALARAGFPQISADHFQSLVPYVEEMEIKQRHLLLGSNLSDHDPRLLSTKDLASSMGVDLTTPWISKRDLEAITQKLAGGKSKQDIQKALDLEFANGDSANLKKITELSTLLSRHNDFDNYQTQLSGSGGLRFQAGLSKSIGNYLAIKQPIDRFTDKIWGGITNIDDIIRAPQRGLAIWWEKTQELHPWLNPVGLFSDRFVKYQTGIALKIHEWATSATSSSGWLKSFRGHVADYTEGFIKHEASWGGAGSFFFQRKIGNALDWATRFATKGKHETLKSLRFAVANKVWSGFTKLAPGLSGKMVASGLSKVIIGIIGGEMTMGVSVAIQVGWEVLKYGFNFIKKLLTDNDFRERFINKIPLLVGGAVSSSLIFLSGLPAAIVAGVGIAGAAILAFLQAMLLSLVPLFTLAAGLSLAIVAFMTLMWYGFISPTFNLDSGVNQLLTNILCENDASGSSSETVESSETVGSTSKSGKVASCANCLVKALTECYGSGMISSEKINSIGIKCIVAKAIIQSSADAISASATQFNWLQCVGFTRAAAICAGGDLEKNSEGRAAGYINNAPRGYRYSSGPGSCRPGDLGLIDGDIGHIFVWGNANGPAMVDAIDANYVCDGCVSAKNPIPYSSIAGCLKLL